MNTQTKSQNELQSTKTDTQAQKPRATLVKGTKKQAPPPGCAPFFGPNW
jgi:hypothetical protein